MLKLVNKSTAKKTTNCAVTYRAGGQDKFATCPIRCCLKPDASAGASKIDIEYLNALSDAVPTGGVSFTYSHFNPRYWKHKLKFGKTTINYSAKNLTDLLLHSFVPAVINVKDTFWNNKKSQKISGKQIVRCPAEYSSIDCSTCGNGRPLCSRLDRSYAIGFTDHGAYKKKAGNENENGGCYATGGNVNLHWKATALSKDKQSDSKKLISWSKALPAGTVLRHHIAGDLGKIE